jgi:succinate dehydrogenase/fumarate reductase flavoprotein subunit
MRKWKKRAKAAELRADAAGKAAALAQHTILSVRDVLDDRANPVESPLATEIRELLNGLDGAIKRAEERAENMASRAQAVEVREVRAMQSSERNARRLREAQTEIADLRKRLEDIRIHSAGTTVEITEDEGPE